MSFQRQICSGNAIILTSGGFANASSDARTTHTLILFSICCRESVGVMTQYVVVMTQYVVGGSGK
jgi:hypothetical protein